MSRRSGRLNRTVWRLPVAAAVITAAGISVAGCGGRTPAGVDKPLVATDASRIAERLSAVSGQVGGSVSERRAGEIVTYHLYQSPIQNCMARAGFSYTPPPFVDLYRGLTKLDMPTGSGVWLAPLSRTGLGVSDTERRLAGVATEGPNPGFDRLDAKGQRAYLVRLNQCQPPAAAYAEANIPPTARNLTSRLGELVEQVESRPEVSGKAAGYASCMRSAGFPAANPVELRQSIAGSFPLRTEASAVGRSGSTAWEAAAKSEQAAAAADARCRAGLYMIALSLLEPQLEAFVLQHESDIEDARRQWADLVVQAQRYPG